AVQSARAADGSGHCHQAITSSSAAATKCNGVEVKIHEYQGKEIFRRFGMATPRGMPAFSVDEAGQAARSLGGSVWVVQAQIHAGGRGKGGGVKDARSLDEVRALAARILGMQLVTHQTGPAGQKGARLLIEGGAGIQ